jgi:Mg-chelatase subunit ChlD
MNDIKATLSEYDFVLVIDKSGSMAEPVKVGSTTSRWQAVQEQAIQFARDVGEIDTDGIGLVLFSGSGIVVEDGVSADKVREVFASNSPRGGTPLAAALTEAFKLAGKSAKKDFVVVFTDGVPDNETEAANVIKAQANKQDADDALTVLFVQVGNDSSATDYLRRLDNSLVGAKFDIVDAKTFEEVDKFATTAELIAAAIAD